MLIEANVDDLDPRVWPSVLDDLLVSGASDAWLIPILMKKGRPAHTLAVLVDPTLADELRARIFALVPTLGVRERAVQQVGAGAHLATSRGPRWHCAHQDRPQRRRDHLGHTGVRGCR